MCAACAGSIAKRDIMLYLSWQRAEQDFKAMRLVNTSSSCTMTQRTFGPARQKALADADSVRAQVVRPELGDGRRRRHALRLPLHLQTMVLFCNPQKG